VLPGTAEEKARQVPDPATYHLLCVLPDVDEEYESGLVKAGQTMHYEEVLSPVLFVVKMGPDCYKDEKRFPSGPSCKVGDFVLVRPNTGTRIKIHGKEFRLINDDSVEGVVQDPRGITRAEGVKPWQRWKELTLNSLMRRKKKNLAREAVS
jgi:co-chaperonin GroES (HSP10)